MNKYDKMVACNRRASDAKIQLARETIIEMIENRERITIPKLIAKTGLSRGFFYKNPTVRKLIEQALEKQVGMIDPKREILDMVLSNEIAVLQEKIRMLQSENDRLKNENQKLQKALDRKNANLLRNL